MQETNLKKVEKSIFANCNAILKSKITTFTKNDIKVSYTFYFYECIVTGNTFGTYNSEKVSYNNGIKEYNRLKNLQNKNISI